jgi:dTDP-4-amino-4,6-dideoxygalactose transaminase
MRNFGHKGQEDFWGIGINGKNSEFHAAMGLSILPYFEEIIKSRKKVYEMYDSLIKGMNLLKPTIPNDLVYNYSYYPVLFQNESRLLAVKIALNQNDIFPRRYFYPALHNLPYLECSKNIISEDITKRVLCLPLYPALRLPEVTKIMDIIKQHT